MDVASRLRQLGWDDVVVRPSGEAVIRAIETGLRPQAVVLDVNFGRGMDGIEAARHIRALGLAVPIVFYTGEHESAGHGRTERLAAHAWIDKSSPERIEATLSRILSELVAAEGRATADGADAPAAAERATIVRPASPGGNC